MTESAKKTDVYDRLSALEKAVFNNTLEPEIEAKLSQEVFRYNPRHEDDFDDDEILESSGREQVDLTKPLGEMTDDELLCWAAKEIAGGFLGGFGSLVFNQLYGELRGRDQSLSALMQDQLQKIEQIFGRVLNTRDREEVQAYAQALGNTVDDYRRAPSKDRLDYITLTSQELLSLCQQPRLRRVLFKTFLTVAGYQLTAYEERAIHASEWGYNASGERENRRRAVHDRLIPYVRDHGIPLWRDYLTEPMWPIVNLGGGPSQGNNFHWVYKPTYRVYVRQVRERFHPLGIKDAEINSMFWPPGRGFEYGRRGDLKTYRYWEVRHHVSVPDSQRYEAEHRLLNEANSFRNGDVDWTSRIILNDTQAQVCVDQWHRQVG